MAKEYKPEELAARVFWLSVAGIVTQVTIIVLLMY